MSRLPVNRCAEAVASEGVAKKKKRAPLPNGAVGGPHEGKTPSDNGFVGGPHEGKTPLRNGSIGAESRGTGGNGRSADGRFTKGNPGGPGNPFARQMAESRRALQETVSEEDLRAIGASMVQKAKEGDVAAAKLVLAYAIGKPTEAVNPDTVDLEEWRLHQQQPDLQEVKVNMCSKIPVEKLCLVTRTMNMVVGQKMTEDILQGLEEQERRDRQAPRKRAGQTGNGQARKGDPRNQEGKARVSKEFLEGVLAGQAAEGPAIFAGVSG